MHSAGPSSKAALAASPPGLGTQSRASIADAQERALLAEALHASELEFPVTPVTPLELRVEVTQLLAVGGEPSLSPVWSSDKTLQRACQLQYD
jgi:hypothetical protein